MTREEQKVFITELIDSVRAEILAKVERMPEQWDGHELRQYVADKFAAASYTLRGKDKQKRYREYLNEVIVRNL